MRDVAYEVAGILLETGAILFSEGEPFTFTSGTKSPVYTDMRRTISFPAARSRMVDLAIAKVESAAGAGAFDVVAGGETAGIPFAAWIADRTGLPMQYVRKKPKGFGRNARIEGLVREGDRVLLVEDLATDGASKVGFVEAIRESGQECRHAVVFFFYDVFPKARETMAALGVHLHYLTTWKDVLARARSEGSIPAGRLDEVEVFLADPQAWSKARHGA